MSKGIKRFGSGLVRVAATLGIIAAIFAVVAGDEETAVQTAEADIGWLDLVERSKHGKFVESVRDYGFDEPQTYKWNGAQMFVSVKQTEKSPQAVLYELQVDYFKKGINQDVYASPPNPDALGDPDSAVSEKMLAAMGAAEFLAGGMVPVANKADYSAMVGVDTVGDAKDFGEFLRDSKGKGSIDDVFNSTRYVEAFRNGSDRNTTVLAIWSDRKLKVSQLTPDGFVHRNIPDMPVCMGCEITSQVEGQGAQQGYVAMTLNSSSTPGAAIEFYRGALSRRGWNEDQAASIAGSAVERNNRNPDGTLGATFRKGNRLMTVQAGPKEEGFGSRVSLFESPL